MQLANRRSGNVLANLTCADNYRHGLSAVGLSAFDRPLAPGVYSFLVWDTCAWHTCSPAAKSLLASSAWGESSQGQFRARLNYNAMLRK